MEHSDDVYAAVKSDSPVKKQMLNENSEDIIEDDYEDDEIIDDVEVLQAEEMEIEDIIEDNYFEHEDKSR